MNVCDSEQSLWSVGWSDSVSTISKSSSTASKLLKLKGSFHLKVNLFLGKTFKRPPLKNRTFMYSCVCNWSAGRRSLSIHNGLLLSDPVAVSPHKTLFNSHPGRAPYVAPVHD